MNTPNTKYTAKRKTHCELWLKEGHETNKVAIIGKLITHLAYRLHRGARPFFDTTIVAKMGVTFKKEAEVWQMTKGEIIESKSIKRSKRCSKSI